MNISNGTPLRRRLRAALPVVVIATIALAGCSGVSGAMSSNGAAADGSSGTTVIVTKAAGQSGVLATAAKRTLYVSDQERGTVLCKKSDCTAIWMPLTVKKGTTPTGPAQLKGKLGTVMRPDGKTQVTYSDKPLYTFSFDHQAGEVTGNGQSDSFDGTKFNWRTATVGKAKVAPSSPSPTNGGGYGY
jgi:predicted lipoprotein with Yx(FWY)xxD motif